MRVLLSAYACEPEKGSEPGVGWHWANEIASRGHHVIVITRSNNQNSIQNIDLQGKDIRFLYYDLPHSFLALKRIFGVHLYYFFWQLGLFFYVKKRLSTIQPDIIHHLTFVSIKKISFLPFLNKPFFYGPLGGGESCPLYLLKGSGFKNIIKELLRDLLNNLVRFRPLSLIIFKKAELIFTTTKESLLYLPKSVRKKTSVSPAIGINNTEVAGIHDFSQNKKDETLRILFVGNFLYLKGIQLALDALSDLKRKNIDFEFTLIGAGEFKKKLQDKAIKLNIVKQIKWINWVPQSQLKKFYESHDLFLFPGLHDSGGMVVVEAQSYGMPVISFNLGGPAYFNNNNIGWVIDVVGKNYSKVIMEMSWVLESIAEDRSLLIDKSTLCKTSSNLHTWQQRVGEVYQTIESYCAKIKNLENTGNT